MKNLLVINVSPSGEASASRQVSKQLVEKLRSEHGTIVERDLAKEPLPHLTPEMIQAYFTPVDNRSSAQKQLLEKSDQLVDELLAADTIVVATPMWNFGPPSVLKSWVDHIVRAGRTFSFAEGKLKGLAKAQKAYVIISSGGLFSTGPMSLMDAVTPSLKSVFSFIGVPEVQIIRVEGTNDPTARENAISGALENLHRIVS
jgi:FMN-dependent NADH-azoreductase